MKELYKKKNCKFIRIYNSNKLSAGDKNSSFINSPDQLDEALSIAMQENKDISRIVFIGAGFLSQSSLFIQLNKEEIDKLIRANILNYLTCVHTVLPYMMKLRSGNLIYLSSFRSKVSSRGISLYAASKAFGEMFFETIGKEYGSLGIYSSSIRMGYFDGRMTTQLEDKKLKGIKLNSGNRRLGQPNDLMNAISYIIDNNYTNGGVLDLTGGINHEF